MEITKVVLLAVTGYMLGSLPSAFLVAKWLKGIDLRELGNGKLGASYTYETAGFWAAALVLVADVGKGALAIIIARHFSPSEPAILVTGLAAILGHDWSVFQGFKGGKGASTTYGVLAAVMFPELLLALALALVPYLLLRKSGLMTAAVFIMMSLFSWKFGRSGLLITTPIILAIPMLLKHLTMPKYGIEEEAAAARKGRTP